jgi:hypothetical protein
MKKAKIAAVLVVVWLVGTLAVAGWVKFQETGARKRADRIVELGAAQKDLLNKMGPNLVKACTGKLTPQGTYALAGYIQAGGKHDPDVFDTIVSANSNEPKRVASSSGTHFYDPPFSDKVKENLNPFDWIGHLERARHTLMLDQTKYVAVSAVWGLVTAEATDDGYDPGAAQYYTRVLTYPEGNVVCEGSTTLRMKGTITGTGRGMFGKSDAESSARRLIPMVWSSSVVATPLADLCALAGGEELCTAMAEETGSRQ